MPDNAPRALPTRVDAARNRARIIAAAKSAFGDGDRDVSMAEISRRAGVSMATLYRNFANRGELLNAIYADEVESLIRAAEPSDDDDPGAAFDTWLRRFFDFYISKRRVASQLVEYGAAHTRQGPGRQGVLDAGRPLLDAAREAGEVQSDLTLEQILDMVAAIATIERPPEHVEPILRSAIASLKPQRS
jgi:AcrR family transcriptional regulator